MDSTKDLTTGSIFKKLVGFMFPVLGALVLQAMYGAVDLLVVGQFGTDAGISGVSTGSTILNVFTFVVTALLMGVTVLIGRYIGANKKERIGKVIGGAIALFIVVAAVLFVVMVFFARPIAIAMQAPEEALDLTVQYIRICGAGIVFIVAYNLISSIFRGVGDSRTPLLFVLIACIVNVFGDLFFVAVLNMNVAGAALATVMAQAVSVILSVIIMKKRGLTFGMKLSDIRFNEEIKGILTIGWPLALQEILTQISFLALCAFINKLGLDASSGYGVACKIVSFIMLIPAALNQSMSAFVSQNYGAHKEGRTRKALLTSILIGLVIGVPVYFLSIYKGDLLSSFFTANEAFIAQSWAYLKGFGPEAIVTAVLFSFIGFFNGHEKSAFVMFQGIAQTFIVRLPVSYFMSIQPDATLTNIGYAAPLATVFGILINLVYFLHFRKVTPVSDEDPNSIR